MKAAFRVDAGEGIGQGHLTRMSALSDAFGVCGAECSFFTSIDEPIDYRGFDAVVADSYLLSSEYIDRLNDIVPFVVCYDDNALYTYSCDVLVNANLHADTLSFRFGRKKPELLLGGQYALLRRAFWDTEPIAIRQDAKRVLLTFGGADINDYTEAAWRAIKDIPNIEIVAVFGSAAKGYAQLVATARKAGASVRSNLTILRDPPSMRAVMRSCDIAITAGGTTVYELAALGIPSLIVAQADNQCLSAKYFDDHGLMKLVGWWKDITPEVLEKETQALLYNFERRKIESGRLLGSVNREGAKHLAEKIMEIYVTRALS